MPVFVMKAAAAPAISVIIPSRDGHCSGNVPRLLASLQEQDRAGEAEILLVVGERPNGHARNVGVDASRGRWLVFIDDDAVLHGARILTHLLAPLEVPESSDSAPIGMTGSATALPPDANRFQRWVARSMPRSLFAEVDRITETDMAHHLCCALPRRVYEAIGRESDTLETGTDVDLRNRLRAAGYRIVVVPHTVAEHPPPPTLRAFVRKHFWYGQGKPALDRLDPPSGKNVIRGEGRGVLAYMLRAVLTAPIRVLRHDRSSPWRWNPLRALADLAQKLGYACAYWRDLHGLPPTGRLFSSQALHARLLPAQRRGCAPPRPDHVARLLVVATAGLGDALAMLPLLQAVRRHYAHAHITAWVSREGAREILRRRGVVDAVEIRNLAARTLAGRLVRKLLALRWLRWQRFDLALVNFINSTEETALLLAKAEIPYRAGYEDDRDVPSLFNLVAPRPPVQSRRQAVRRHLDLLAALGLPWPTETRPHWPVPAEERRAARQLLAAHQVDANGLLVGLHPGCGSDMAWKRWPAERFAALADRLAASGARVLLFGGPDEHLLVEAVREQMRAPALNLCEVSDLDRTAALMQCCRLLVANDSGLLNLALAVGVPVVAIFGPSLPQISRPHPTEHPAVVVTQPMPCHPCYDYRRPPARLACPIERACLTGVSVGQAEEACRAALAGPRTPTVSEVGSGEERAHDLPAVGGAP